MSKRLIFLCVVLLSVYLTEQTHFLAKEHIQEINNVAKTWKAKQNFPPNTSLHQMKRLMGSILDKNRRFEPSSIDLKEHDSSNFKKIPKTFDARTHWSNCTILDDIPNQGNCGSCWAVATSSAFSDRVCIATKGEVNQLLSIEQLTFCCHRCGYGCFGGLPFLAWHYIEYHGLVTGGHYSTTDGCQPYQIPPCVEDEKGQNSCSGKPMEFNHMCPTEECYGDKRIKYRDNNFKTKKSYQLNYDSYQKEVLAHGPIVVTFMVYDDFVSYGSGVYYKTEGARELGGHAVKLIGWGEERGVPYWLCVNSWGPQWGDDGVFKIRRGVNECGIDAGATAGLPRVA